MKHTMQKNHYNIAAHIGKYWGDSKSSNKNREKKIYYLDILDFLSHFHNESHHLSHSIKENKTAQEISYSKVYFQNTENNLLDIDGKYKKVNDIEQKFLTSVNNYLNPNQKINFMIESIQNAIQDYVALQLLREPLHYELMNQNISHKSPDILHINKIIETNNIIMRTYFSKNKKQLEEYTYHVIDISSQIFEIFLGTITCLTKNSSFYGNTISNYLNNKYIVTTPINDLDNFIVLPMTPKKFIIGFKKQTKENSNIKIEFFKKNINVILEFWNTNQIITSHEVILTENTNKYIDSHFIYETESPEAVISEIKSRFDYILNNNFNNTNQIESISAKYNKWKTEIININNKFPVNGLTFNFIEHKVDTIIEKLEISVACILFNQPCIIQYQFEIDCDGCIFINENNKRELFSYNFYWFFHLFLDKIEEKRPFYLNNKMIGSYQIFFSLLRQSPFFHQVDNLNKKYHIENQHWISQYNF